jgi:N-acetylmuramoyl-L-alanine amidase
VEVATEEAEVPGEKAEVSSEAEISAESLPAITKVTVIPVKGVPRVELSKPSTVLSGKTIVLDPGHGGKDPGYIGRSGVLEKRLTLKVALKLKAVLENAGAKVFLTRSADVSTKDREIVALANAKKADLFVAIHFNSYPSPKAGGCETYYFMPYSKKFAGVMQKNLSRAIKRRDRGIKKVTYYTIHHAKMPAVLVEPIYLTNLKEEKLVLTPQFQSSVAYGIYKGIAEYAKITPHGRNRERKARSFRQSDSKGPGNT